MRQDWGGMQIQAWIEDGQAMIAAHQMPRSIQAHGLHQQSLRIRRCATGSLDVAMRIHNQIKRQLWQRTIAG